MALKYCGKCLESKELSQFNKDKSRKDGICHWCKGCNKKLKRRQRLDDSEIERKKYVKRMMPKWVENKVEEVLILPRGQ